jgi:hypothetical protein
MPTVPFSENSQDSRLCQERVGARRFWRESITRAKLQFMRGMMFYSAIFDNVLLLRGGIAMILRVKTFTKYFKHH